jgi:hypothetical protein
LWAALLSFGCGRHDGAPRQVFTEDGAWCWFQDPRAVYVKGGRERTYAQWVTHTGRLQLGAYDHADGSMEFHVLKANWGADDHNAGAFLVLPDNRLMVFYARHRNQGIFCRMAQVPEDIAQWGDEVTVSAARGITYANPVYLSAEKKFYVFWRGPTLMPTFSTSDDGIVWSAPQVLIQDVGIGPGDTRPYCKIAGDGISSIHFAFTDDHPNAAPHNSVYYMRYEGGCFFKADGARIGNMDALPIPHARSDRVYDGGATNARAWVWDLAVDQVGNPVIAYVRFPAETDHRYCYARWSGKRWLNVEITRAGKWFPQTPPGKAEAETFYSGGMGLDHSDPSILYLSRETDGVFEIEKWETLDGGKAWKSTSITRNSEQNNVRPVVPLGYPGTGTHLLWMCGAYEAYAQYGTGIILARP